MSDAAATGGFADAPGGGAPAGLSGSEIDGVLADFRAWLTALPQEPGDREQEPEMAGTGSLSPASCLLSPGVDLFTLVGQFTALRHEVNLQTKAARAATEQTAEALKLLAAAPAAPPAAEPDDTLRPVVKAVLDITDALTLSLRQMERLRESAEPLLDDLASGDRPVAGASEDRRPDGRRSPRRGFFARLFGGATPAPEPPAPAPDPAKPAADKLRQLVAAAADGYAMSLRRVERALPALGLEPLASEGEPFDPETMEVVEVVADAGLPAGTVVEDVRPGYRWRGKLFRYAQVKVAR